MSIFVFIVRIVSDTPVRMRIVPMLLLVVVLVVVGLGMFCFCSIWFILFECMRLHRRMCCGAVMLRMRCDVMCL